MADNCRRLLGCQPLAKRTSRLKQDVQGRQLPFLDKQAKPLEGDSLVFVCTKGEEVPQTNSTLSRYVLEHFGRRA